MHDSNVDLLNAFPASLRDDAFRAVSAFPENPYPGHPPPDNLSLTVAGQSVTLPRRIYHKPNLLSTILLTSIQKELVHCLLTRHNDGFVREHYLTRIIASSHHWVPPFVLQLAGEYVVEILQVIHDNVGRLDRSVYEQFLRANPEFLLLTEQRIISYWNCYYRNLRKEEYVGFQLLAFFKSLVR